MACYIRRYSIPSVISPVCFKSRNPLEKSRGSHHIKTWQLTTPDGSQTGTTRRCSTTKRAAWFIVLYGTHFPLKRDVNQWNGRNPKPNSTLFVFGSVDPRSLPRLTLKQGKKKRQFIQQILKLVWLFWSKTPLENKASKYQRGTDSVVFNTVNSFFVSSRVNQLECGVFQLVYQLMLF